MSVIHDPSRVKRRSKRPTARTAARRTDDALSSACNLLRRAQVLFARDRFVESETAARRALLKLGEKGARDAEGDRVRAMILIQHGHALRSLGEYERALEAFVRARVLSRRTFGSNSLEVASALNGYGIVCKYAGWYSRGERAYQRALAITENELGPRHPQTASILHNLGGIEHARGRYAAAEAYAQRAVRIRRNARTSSPIDIATNEAALAAIVDELGKKKEAERLYRGALPIFLAAKARYDTAVTANNLAALVAERGAYDEAARLYALALRTKVQLLGEEHPDVAMTLNNLGALHAAQGNASRARSHYERALAIFTRALGARHDKTRACRANLASAFSPAASKRIEARAT